MLKLHEARALLLTDIDGSMIGYDGKRDGVREAVELLNVLNVKVVPVTAKTLSEVRYLGEELGFTQGGLIAIVELGGAICVDKNTLWFPETPVEVNGFECLVLGGFIEDFEEPLEDVVRECNALRLSKASVREAEEVTGLRGFEAYLATRRLFLEVLWSSDRKCLERASKRLTSLGLNTVMGKRFLHVGLHEGKRDAVITLLRITKNLAHNISRVIGIGDSWADVEFLELVDTPIIVPQEDLSPSIRLQRADYIIAPYPAPTGWVWIARQIAYDVI